jgi:hypothetical protein
MNIVLVKNMKLGKIYKELKSKLLGRLCDKYLIINTDNITPSIKKNETNSHFSNGLVADKNNFDDDNRPKILSGRCNIHRNYNIPYYELEFLTDKKEKIFVMKDWNDQFLEIPNDDGIPEIDYNSIKINKLNTEKEKVFFIKTIQNGILYNIDIKQYQ